MEQQSQQQELRSAPPLIPPYGISQTEPSWSRVQGSSPSWHSCNLQSKGKAHTTEQQSSQLLTTKLANWGLVEALPDASHKKHMPGPATGAVITQPVAVNGNRAYYKRRQHVPHDSDPAAAAQQDSSYRRVLKHVPEPTRQERPEGRRHVAVPQGTPQRSGTLKLMPAQRAAEAQRAPEPDIPRMARTGLARTNQQRSQEQSLEGSMQPKGKVGPEAARGTGRAGDLSQLRGKPQGPEDKPGFFAKLQDPPTYIRYVKSLPAPPEVSPQQRRSAAEQRQQRAEVQADVQLVQSLGGPVE